MADAMHSVSRRNGNGAHFFACGAGRPGGRPGKRNGFVIRKCGIPRRSILRVGLDRFVRVLILESRAPINNQYVVFTDETSGHCSSDIVGVVSYRLSVRLLDNPPPVLWLHLVPLL